MRHLSAQDLLRRYGIPYVVNPRNGKYTTTCPKCGGKYLSVRIDSDRACWLCRDCGYSGPPPGAPVPNDSRGNGGLGRPVKLFDYEDEHGRRLFQVLRFEPPGQPKTFRQRTGPDQEKWSIAGVRIVPFMLPQLLEDLAQGHVVFVVEGEKDVLTLRRHGIPATTNPMGAGKWWSEFNEILRGADVVLCGDHDQAGREHVALVARNLKGVAGRLRVLDLAAIWPNIQASEDVSDWFEHGGGTAEALWAALERLPDDTEPDEPPPPPPPPPQPQPRPRVQAPGKNDPWIPVMDKINAVLGASGAPEPPARDIDGFMTHARKLVLPGLHLFTTANEQDDAAEVLPAPEQYLLHRMGVVEVSELIERHIDYIRAKGKSVHLPTAYVRHYLQRHDGVLPQAVAISTLPLVLDDGRLLAPVGLDRERGIIFKVPHQLHNILPRREECTEGAVRKAMRFLCDDWLVDVATDFTGKCIHIAAALTMIERSLLPERPCFFVTAGKSRGGKTTLLKMMVMAVTGQLAAAAAWSSDENERRKALLGYLLSGVAYILWDNIPRGERLSCPHVERSCTTSYYIDRRLGVSEVVTAAASTLHLFTGNNIGARGDLASRSLELRIDVDRPDPENREFKHPDPIGWTEHNRSEILAALYTIMLGNPALKSDAAGGTRFKTWYRLVGSAVEHAAGLVGEYVDFQKLFLAQEADGDEDMGTLAEALVVMARRWPLTEFVASDIAKLINREGATSDLDDKTLHEMKHDSAILRDLLFPDEGSNFTATAKAVGHRLKNHVDEPVQYGDEVLKLRARTVHNTLHFFVSRS
jgi:hypothetical protein